VNTDFLKSCGLTQQGNRTQVFQLCGGLVDTRNTGKLRRIFELKKK